MTNTKFRKRALLSSVAMLLVALVALGSATFAWFSADPNAHTSSLTLKATSSTGLLIQSASEKGIDTNWWTHTAVLHAAEKAADGNSMTPGGSLAIGAASQDAGEGTLRGIYRVDAASDGASAADTDKAVTAAGTGDMFEEKLYLKVTGAESANVQLTKVNATTVGTTNLAKAIRIAVLKSDGTCLGIWKPSGATDNTYLTGTATKFSSAVVSDSTYTGKVFGSAQTIALGSIGNNGEDYVTVRVFLDGQDAQVYSLNIAQADLSSVVSNVVLDFTIPA